MSIIIYNLEINHQCLIASFMMSLKWANSCNFANKLNKRYLWNTYPPPLETCSRREWTKTAKNLIFSKSKGHYSVENCSIVIKIVHDLEIILIIISICATSAKKNVWKLMVNRQIGRQINIVIILPYFAHLEV